MKLGIISTSTFIDLSLVYVIYNKVFNNLNVSTILGIESINSIAANTARKFEKDYIEIPIDTKSHGKNADQKRNVDFVLNSDMILAFHDGYSKGTQSILDLVRAHKKPVLIWYI